MNPESQAWLRLQAHAAAQLPPDFAARVLRHAHEPEPSPAGQFLVGACAAAACAAAVMFLHAQTIRAADSSSLAGWQAIASTGEDIGQAQ